MSNEEKYILRDKVFEINKEAARYYRDMLFSEEGEEGMKYLLSRGLTRKTIRKYGLGYATRNWRGLYNHLKDKGYSDSEMELASLISTDERACDKFKYRVMFPIVDRMKNVIAFGGRALERDANAKYLNSSETIVFHKSNNVFSINFAMKSDKDYLILCEGYMDVIALNQAGYDNAVATLGTAITSQQAILMSRYTSSVVIAYDSDEAGQKATQRAIELLTEAGIDVKILKMSGAKDPDEYIKKYSKESFEELVANSQTVKEFRFEKMGNAIIDASDSEMNDILSECVDFISSLPTKNRDECVEKILISCERRKK